MKSVQSIERSQEEIFVKLPFAEVWQLFKAIKGEGEGKAAETVSLSPL